MLVSAPLGCEMPGQAGDTKPDYFQRAEDLRALAKGWPEGASKREMMQLADEWEAMARRRDRFGHSARRAETSL